jgi:hypothetical protein
VLHGALVRSPARILVGALALVLLVSCSHGSGDSRKPSANESPSSYVATGTWDAAFMMTMRGLDGSFRSRVVGPPCTEPITNPCVVGGAQISDAGVFTTGPDGARYEHYAVGLDADVTEASGYHTLLVPNGDDFISAMGRTSRGGCWAPILGVPEFGSQWPPMPVGFAVLLNADADDDPPLGSGTTRFGGVADVDLILRYLGLQRLYNHAADHYGWSRSRVPIELRVDADGRPAGFSVDGARVAESLVGPEPTSVESAPAALLEASSDDALDAEVRHTLTPIRGEFSVFDLGQEHAIVLPPKDRLLTQRAEGDDPCPSAR